MLLFCNQFCESLFYLHGGDGDGWCGGSHEFCVCRPYLNAYVWNDDAVTGVDGDVHGCPSLFGDGRCRQRERDGVE